MDLPLWIAVGAFNSRWQFLTNCYENEPSVAFIKIKTQISSNVDEGGGFIIFQSYISPPHFFTPHPWGRRKLPGSGPAIQADANFCLANLFELGTSSFSLVSIVTTGLSLTLHLFQICYTDHHIFPFKEAIICGSCNWNIYCRTLQAFSVSSHCLLLRAEL